MSNILYIVEGKAEYGFIKKMWGFFDDKRIHHVYQYNTNIHTLINHLFENNDLDSDIDIIKLLKTEEKDSVKKEILEKKYSDIFIIFDLEPHDNKIDPVKIRKLLDHYSDSTDEGKLLINYPMLESYRDIKSMDDLEFKERSVTLEECSKYKEIVGNRCMNILKNYSKCDFNTFINITKMHLMKANFIIDGEYIIPSENKYFNWNNTELFDIQINSLLTTGTIKVVNTSILSSVDYRPSLFFNNAK